MTDLPARPDPATVDLARLAEYIVDRHHVATRRLLDRLGHSLRDLVRAHPAREAEATRMAEIFDELDDELRAHLAKEEQILFPFVRALANAKATGTSAPRAPFVSIANPIARMHAEHGRVDDLLGRMRAIAKEAFAPLDAEMLELERDLAEHVALEDGALFPRAVDLELELLA